MKVFIGPSSFASFSKEPLKVLEERGIQYELNLFGKALSEEQILSRIPDLDGIIAGLEPLNKKVLSHAKKLKVISRVGVGLDTVDTEVAKKLNIPVEYTPDGPTDAVAELTVGLILDRLRSISNQNQNIKNGVWKKISGNLLNQKTIGLIGFGRIGRRVAELLKPFRVSLMYYDPFVHFQDESMKKVDLNDLLTAADIISLHIPYSEENHNLINEEKIRMVKSSAILINASRGGLIDEVALCKALKEKRIAGAALDTFLQEPYKGPLCKCENVVLTPHIGSLTYESRIKMELDATENLLKHL